MLEEYYCNSTVDSYILYMHYSCANNILSLQ